MKHLKPILIALLIQVVALFAPVLVLLALPFVRWDADLSLDPSGRYPATRGDLPGWMAWLGTPDERLPGGLYEPAVLSIYKRFGRFFCAWYWLGVRNRVHGFAAWFGVPTAAGWPGAPGYYERGGLWWLRYPLLGGRLALKAGYRIYTLPDKSFLAVPVFTITKA
ncbi:hypothetical protein [Rhodoferax sp. WC2427]|uniref:DUF7338 family protein n=1 Tax=Rhodoferax sp. WC2427 TaxID=3234144 RepID=UPI0034661604